MTNDSESSHPPISEVPMCTDRPLQVGGSAQYGKREDWCKLATLSAGCSPSLRSEIGRNYGLTCIWPMAAECRSLRWSKVRSYHWCIGRAVDGVDGEKWVGLVRDEAVGRLYSLGVGKEGQLLLTRTRIVMDLIAANDLPSIAVAEPLHLGLNLPLLEVLPNSSLDKPP